MNVSVTSPLVVFRVDGSAVLGGGHVRRCLMLANGLARAGWRVGFASKASLQEIGFLDAISAFEMLIVDEVVDEPCLLRNRWQDGCELLIVDHYELDQSFERGCRGWAGRILVIDDLAGRCHDCDVLIDQTPGRQARNYEDIVSRGCALFLGPDYALLDPRFAAARSRFQREYDSVFRVLVTFGYSDRAGVTAMALEGILRSRIGAAVDVVFGIEPPDIEYVRTLASQLPGSRIHINTDEMVSLIMRADLAIGAGGVSALERCCLGLPSMLITLAENQQGNADALMQRGAAVALGGVKDVSVAKIARELLALSFDGETRMAMGRAAALVTDGSGVDRIVRYFTNDRPWSGTLN
jgi:UDP-2,4-diacetamido-2,4,6-trideoxy-beta-L-altropyranose hydrolase